MGAGGAGVRGERLGVVGGEVLASWEFVTKRVKERWKPGVGWSKLGDG